MAIFKVIKTFSFSLVTTVSNFRTNYLDIESWKKWYISLVLDFPSSFNGHKFRKSKDIKKKVFEFDDDIAVEVLTYRKNLYNFGGKIID